MEEYQGQRLQLVDVRGGCAAAVCCDLMVWVWRQPPRFAEAEQSLGALTKVLNSPTRRPGLWVVTEPGCEIPSVSVRRAIAVHLRLCRVRYHAATVEGGEARGTLMRAAMRAIAVAGGVHSAQIALNVASVAEALPAHFPSLGPVWGQHVVRALRAAMTDVRRSVPPLGAYFAMGGGAESTARSGLSAR